MTALSVVGHVLNVIGALVLVIGTIRAHGAAIRAMAATMSTAELPLFQRIAVRATRRLASTNVQLTTPNLIGDYTATVLGAGLLVLGFLGQAIGQVGAQAPRGGSAHEIRAHRFVVVDEKGRTRAELGRTGGSKPGNDSFVGLNLFDESETSRARMFLHRCDLFMNEEKRTNLECPSLEFYTEDPGYLQVRLEAGPSLGSGLEFLLRSGSFVSILDNRRLEFRSDNKTTWRTP